MAAACYVPSDIDVDAVGLSDVNDSKAVKKEDRERMYDLLTSHPKIKYGVCAVSAKEIDQVNILQASMLAMHRATASLPTGVAPDYVLIDGNRAHGGMKKQYAPLAPTKAPPEQQILPGRQQYKFVNRS